MKFRLTHDNHVLVARRLLLRRLWAKCLGREVGEDRMILPPSADRMIFDAMNPPTVIQPLVVCDGWIEPRHPRVVLQDGDLAHLSHGMCPTCSAVMRAKMDPRKQEGR